MPKHRLLALGLLAALLPAWAQTPAARKLSLREAVELALKSHPQVLAADALTGAAGEQVREASAAYYPTLRADVTTAQANTSSRLGAGGFSAPRLFNRAGQGFELSQLVTDFGRTRNLVSSARLEHASAQQDALTARYNVVLGVHQAYYNVLQAKAVVQLAEETVRVRQQLVDQVSALAANKLRSQLDLSYANVNLSDAKLMLIRAQDNLQQAYAELARAIGADAAASYELSEEPMPGALPPQADPLIAEAIQKRPELASLRLSSSAAASYAEAEKDLARPNVTLAAAAGALPWISAAGIPTEYESVAVNVDIPLFNGHLYTARREAARYRATAAEQRLKDAQLRVARDVRSAYANASTAYRRLDVATQFVDQAKQSLELARGRYDLGLASIIELTQSDLNLTRAKLEDLNARYDYQLQHAVLSFSIGALR